MFGEWLDDQRKRDDEVGKFARLAWDDFTSGCARWYHGAVEWRDHFASRHPDKVAVVYPLLREAFTAYADEALKTRA